ncbi:response regulator [Spirosoma endbachense]|uniref:Response regulator n=1 Tax=Spirosoma endbachense TaxID=2666025 RepID=A0A6P1W6P1_9BACT|nr:response regulator transcription factor [Spirosoma endbachense]QHW00239.1 response regulator [Spirosoma endbachense]
MAGRPVKLLLVDDHQIILDGLRFLFSSIENVEVTATFTDSRQILPYLQTHPVDILVADLHMPHLTGIDLTLQVRPLFPELKILLLTMAEDAAHIREAVRAGVHGYVLKKANKADLEKALMYVLAGQRFYSDEVINELAQAPTDNLNLMTPATIQHLTGREVEILKLISEEQSTAEIADKLCISVPTVETHRRNLMIKLNAKNVVGLVKYALKHGLV